MNSAPREAHPAILVRDISELRERLASQGLLPVDDEPLAGSHRLYIDDPFGNRLELVTRRDADTSLGQAAEEAR